MGGSGGMELVEEYGGNNGFEWSATCEIQPGSEIRNLKKKNISTKSHEMKFSPVSEWRGAGISGTAHSLHLLSAAIILM
jgi:hypothetical protein